MSKLDYYRKKIDLVDRNIVKLLLLRFRLVKQISSHKKRNKIKMTDRKREQQIIKKIGNYNKPHQKFLKEIFSDIIKYSKKLQNFDANGK